MDDLFWFEQYHNVDSMTGLAHLHREWNFGTRFEIYLIEENNNGEYMCTRCDKDFSSDFLKTVVMFGGSCFRT